MAEDSGEFEEVLKEDESGEFEVVGIDDEVEPRLNKDKARGVERSMARQTFDEERARQVIDEAFAVLQEEIINVQNSGFWLSVFALFYGLVEGFGIPLLTVVSLLVLAQMAFVVFFVSLQPYLVDAGIIDSKYDARWIAEQRTSFSDNEMNSIKKGFAALGYKWTKFWEDEVLATDQMDHFLFYLGVLVIYTVVTAIISLPVILLVSGVTITFFPLMVDQFESTDAMVEALQQVTTSTLTKFEDVSTDLRRAVSGVYEEE